MKNLDYEKYQLLFLEKLQKEGKSFNTIKNYKTDLNIFKQFLISKGRQLSLTEVTLQELQEFNLYLNNKYSSANSIRRRIQALRIFFDYLISQAIFDENPIKKILVAPKVVNLPKPASFSLVKELHQYLKHHIENSRGHEKLLALRNMMLFYLIYGAGLKVSDIERLNSFHISQFKKTYRVLISPEKRDPFSVLLPDSFSDYYEQYQQVLDNAKNKDHIEFEHFLFNANPFKILSGGLSARGIEIIFKEFSQLLKSQITAKNLRQACIFKWLCQKQTESQIKEWMGVQPQYSLAPYTTLIKEEPHKYSYLEL
ncbi:MAG: site-specific integrase [Bacteriovoracaceae bacterium]|jgi:site-specific recombinase XerD|nr:site-specific integrase [Bacteriovoracaceae bacterium]